MSIKIKYLKVRLYSGFTLIELMIAMVISLFLLAGVVQIYSSNRESYRTSESMSRLQESARYVGETLSRELRMANHAGCKFFPSEDEDEDGNVDGIENVVNDSSDDSYVLWDIGAINFKVYSGSSIAGSNLNSILTDTDYDTNSDVLFIRKMSENTALLSVDFTGGSDIYFQLLSNNIDLSAGNLYLVNDCDSKVALFQAQQVKVDTDNYYLYLSTDSEHSSPSNTKYKNPGNKDTFSTLLSNFPSGSEIGELESSIIFLKTVDGVGGKTGEIVKLVLTYDSTNNEPTASSAQVLVRGVESLRFVFGMDTNQDGSADTFKTTASMADDDWLKVAVARATYTVSTESELNSGIDYSSSEGASEGNLWGALSGVSNADDLDGKVVRRFTKLIDLRNPPRF